MVRKESVIAILGSPIAYYAAFAKVLGGVEAGVFASQFFYWYGKGHDPEGWIYKTQADIEDETGLTRRNQEMARRRLRQLGVLEENRMGVPAKLYYRLNLNQLFELMDKAFDPDAEPTGKQEESDPDSDEEEEGADPDPTIKDVQNAHPRMSKTRILECPDRASKDVQIAHPRMSKTRILECPDQPDKNARSVQTRLADPAKLECANPPDKIARSGQTNTKNTTKTTTEITTQTTTTDTPPSDGVHQPSPALSPESVVVTVSDSQIPPWVLDEFRELLDAKRTVNDADLAALADLCAYPDHVVEDSFNAARAWLQDPSRGPIHSLGRWLVGTASRKQEAERRRGNGVSAEVEIPMQLDWGQYDDRVEEKQPERPEDQTWSQVLTDLALSLPSATYQTWIHDTWLLSAGNDEYVVGVATSYARDWLEYRMTETIEKTVMGVIGQPVNVRFEVASIPHH